jgi:hypothetical protein
MPMKGAPVKFKCAATFTFLLASQAAFGISLDSLQLASQMKPFVNQELFCAEDTSKRSHAFVLRNTTQVGRIGNPSYGLDPQDGSDVLPIHSIVVADDNLSFSAALGAGSLTLVLNCTLKYK